MGVHFQTKHTEYKKNPRSVPQISRAFNSKYVLFIKKWDWAA